MESNPHLDISRMYGRDGINGRILDWELPVESGSLYDL